MESGIRITDIVDTNINAFLPFVPDSMRRLYGKPSCLFIGAVDGEGFASGVLVAAYMRRWEVLWIYVAEECRRAGMASALLGGLLNHYSSRKSGEITACITEVMDHRALIPLFKKAGYFIEEMGDGAYFETGIGKVDCTAFGETNHRYAEPFGAMTLGRMGKLNRWLAAQEGSGQIPLPVQGGEYESYSHTGWDRGRAVGACLVRKNARGLQVSLPHVEKGRVDVLMEILSETLRGAKAAHPGTMRIGALALNDVSARLCRKLASGAEEYKACRAVWRAEGEG